MNQNAEARYRAGASGGILMAGSPFLGLLPPDLAQRPKDAYFLVQDFESLAVSGTRSVTTAITTEAALLILGGVRVVTSADNLTTVPFYPALVTITDGSQRELMNSAGHIENLFGTAQLPNIWTWPKFIAAGSQIKTTIQSLDTANIRTIRLVYFGFKIY